MTHEVPLQHHMFKSEPVDNRTAKQKKLGNLRTQPQTMEMFSAKEIAPIGVNPHPALPFRPGAKPKLVLDIQDTRTPEEIEAARMREAQSMTYALPTIERPEAKPDAFTVSNQVKAKLDALPNPEPPTEKKPTAIKKGNPLYQQYLGIKVQFPEAILFFRLGDFFETFGEDAELLAEELDVVLTTRAFAKDQRVTMAGVPYHAAEQYLTRLIENGHTVAVCDQVGDEPINGLIPRQVVQVVTKGEKVSMLSNPVPEVKTEPAKTVEEAVVYEAPKTQTHTPPLGPAGGYTTVLTDGGIRIMWPL